MFVIFARTLKEIYGPVRFRLYEGTQMIDEWGKPLSPNVTFNTAYVMCITHNNTNSELRRSGWNALSISNYAVIGFDQDCVIEDVRLEVLSGDEVVDDALEYWVYGAEDFVDPDQPITEEEVKSEEDTMLDLSPEQGDDPATQVTLDMVRSLSREVIQLREQLTALRKTNLQVISLSDSNTNKTNSNFEKVQGTIKTSSSLAAVVGVLGGRV